MAHEVLLTPAGYDKIKKELDELKTVVRPNIADAIREAKSHGDLRENAAYHEAKLNQQRNDGRIADLEKVLQIAKIVERPEGAGDMAHLGSQVTLLDLEFGDELTITLVGNFEADPANDMISIASPLGEAILGKSEGDEVSYTAPAGEVRYRIKSVSHDPA
ncbi:MAG: transcription elongation factor GreA [Fimbriimonadaceae bacterium]|nr:transcription elongation factor GreA [Fimbriimonadaceae bacterium]